MASVAIVGAGLGGLAAACHLRGRGHDVVVLEQRDVPGGRAGRWEVDGFAFDTGPTVVTMRDILDETFAAVGASSDEHVTLRRLDPAYRACFADGSEIAVRAHVDDMADEIGRVCGRADAAGFRRFVDWVTDLHRVEMPSFIARDLPTPLSLVGRPGAMLQLLRLGGFAKLHRRIASYFSDERLRRLFSFQALYAGLSPLDALAIYAVIAYMDTVQGVYAVDGGVRAIPQGLADALVKGGGDIRCGAWVEAVRPRTRDRRCAVVLRSGEVLEVDEVVVNRDLPLAYEDILDVPPPRRVRTATHSPSCVVWLFGSRGEKPPAAAHHNIHFGRAWATSFHELLDQGRPMSDPSRLVTAASAEAGGAAPEGHHGVYVLEPTPNLTADLDWASTTRSMTDRMVSWAQGLGYLCGDPVVLRTTAPPQWRAQGMARGTPFGIDHRFSQSGPFRPGLRDRRLPGVVFVGSSTRPGVGVPMVLLSGRLAADAVDAELHG